MEESNVGEGVAADSFVGDGPVSFISERAESNEILTESRAFAGDTSELAKSGSMMHGDLCKGVEDNGCSLLACMMLSLLSAVIGIVDKDGTE